jgi:hypothetical protein
MDVRRDKDEDISQPDGQPGGLHQQATKNY